MALELYYNLRFICVRDSKVLLLLEVEVRGDKVQQVLRHQLRLQGNRNIMSETQKHSPHRLLFTNVTRVYDF